MKKRLLSLILLMIMTVSAVACGETLDKKPAEADYDTTDNIVVSYPEDGEEDEYPLEQINIVVDGTMTANANNRQDAFVEQWEEAVSNKLGHPIKLNINQLDHSEYVGTVAQLLTTGNPGEPDYPDALIMSGSMLRHYSTTDLLWDMADAYDNAEFQSRITLPSINENLKDADGHLYGFAPNYGNGCVTYVKKSWLDAVGMKAEDIKTFDDYYDMLLAFKNEDPDGNGEDGTYGVIASGFAKLDETPYINYLPEFWQGAYPTFYEKDGKWVDGFTEDATLDALNRLAKGYADGVIDPETMNADTKRARAKFFGADQSVSEGVFTYWAGKWYKTLIDNMEKQGVDNELGDERLVMLEPIKEIRDTWGGYLNREAPVWVITDDHDGDSSREQAIFDALIETMLDGDRVQTLWTYGAEDVHWSTKAESFTINPDDPLNKEEFNYEEGEFHLRPYPKDPNTIWKINYLDPILVIAPLTNGFGKTDAHIFSGIIFFTENCVEAPHSPSSVTLYSVNDELMADRTMLIDQVVTGEKTADEARDEYNEKWGSVVDQILKELNNK